jgi:hypothetical protein
VMGITVNDVISCFCSCSCVSEFPRDYARRGSFFTLPFQIASLGHNLILFLTSSHNRKYKCFSAPSGLSRSKSERRRTYKHIMQSRSVRARSCHTTCEYNTMKRLQAGALVED